MFRCQTIALVALILFGRLDSSPGAESGRKVLRGHVPAAGSQFTPKGRLPGTDELPLAIGVPLRDPAGLDQFLADVYSPASAHYRHFLTPEEFAARFSATEADYAAVRNYALAKGFKITGEHSNRQVLDVAGSVANIEQAFQIKLNRYDHPDEPREFFAPDAEPTVDSALPILHVSGLDNFSPATSEFKNRTTDCRLRRGSQRRVGHQWQLYGRRFSGGLCAGSEFDGHRTKRRPPAI